MLNDSPNFLRSPSLSNSNSSLANVNQNQSNQPNQPIAFSSSYPLPPMQYVNLYSDENILKAKSLDPPKPITEGSYTMFGTEMTNDDAIIRPLESQNIKRLYAKDSDHKKELKKMNASILINFLDLIDILVKCPDTNKREEKCKDIGLLFIQMHHLINELRPHQARETIRVTLQSQKKQRAEITKKLNKQIDKVNEMVINCINNIPEIDDTISQEEIEFLKEMKRNLETKEYDFDLVKQPYSQINSLDSIMCNIIDEI